MPVLRTLGSALVVSTLLGVGCGTRPSEGDGRDGGGSDHSGGRTGGTGGVGAGGSSGGDGGGAGSGGAIVGGSGGTSSGGAAGTGSGGAGAGGGGGGGAGMGGRGGVGGIGGGSTGGGQGGGASAGSGGGGAGGGTISYAGCSFVGGVNKVVIAKRDTARNLCVVLVLNSPGNNPFNLTLPENMGMESAYAIPAQADCRQRNRPPGAASAIAGTGSVVALPTPQPTYRVDVTFTFQPDASVGVAASEYLMANNVVAGMDCP